MAGHGAPKAPHESKAPAKPEAPKAESKPEAPKAESKPEAPKAESKPEAPKAESKPEAKPAESKPEAKRKCAVCLNDGSPCGACGALRPEPGLYVLPHVVRNPDHDARAKFDWRKLRIIPAGTRIIVTEMMDNETGEHNTWLSIPDDERRITWGDRGKTPMGKPANLKLWADLTVKMRKVPDSIGSIEMANPLYRGGHILAKLVDDGAIDIDDIKVAADALGKFSDEEREAFNARHMLT